MESTSNHKLVADSNIAAQGVMSKNVFPWQLHLFIVRVIALLLHPERLVAGAILHSFCFFYRFVYSRSSCRHVNILDNVVFNALTCTLNNIENNRQGRVVSSVK